MTISAPQLGQDIEAILVDQTMYLKVPGTSSGKPWLAVDLTNSPLPGLSSLNTSEMLQGLDGAAGVRALGVEDVAGVKTTHYAVTVDAKQALESLGMTGAAPTAELPKRLTYDVWVDDQDLVRRIATDISSVSLDMTFSDYGEPVDISAPPADQVTKAPTR